MTLILSDPFDDNNYSGLTGVAMLRTSMALATLLATPVVTCNFSCRDLAHRLGAGPDSLLRCLGASILDHDPGLDFSDSSSDHQFCCFLTALGGISMLSHTRQ